MKDIKSYLIDFVEGRVSVPEFIEHCESHPELLDYLTSVADPETQSCNGHYEIDENGRYKFIVDQPYNAKATIEFLLNLNDPDTLGKYLNIHDHIARVLTATFPEEPIKVDQTLRDKFRFMISACPGYIGGTEVDHLIEEQLELLPEGLSKAERTKLFKERMKEIFHIEGRKFPYWVQSPDWPMGSNGKPMRFVKQIRAKGKLAIVSFTTYYFVDVETGEQRIVEQFS